MTTMMHRNKSVNVHQFTMIPRADIPRSKFRVETSHKTTFDGGDLIPFYVDEVLPGDQHSMSLTAFARMATPLFPVMDNAYMDFQFWFVPCRLVWDNWQRMNGQQDNPGDSISYTVPQIVSKAGGYDRGSIYDYLGLPTAGQVGVGNTYSHMALPLRAYNLIYNEWYRDENLQNSVAVAKGDGPDLYTAYSLLKRGKRGDYFTSALPWPQKGTSVSLPLGTTAPVRYAGTLGDGNFIRVTDSAAANGRFAVSGTNLVASTVTNAADKGLYTDLTAATAATINQLRQSFQIQKLLERDARGGTRYTEVIRQHFGVISPDARLQRPEYLGGGSVPVTVNPVAQTSASNITGGSTPMGTLGAAGTALAKGVGWSQAFTEHGYVIGIVSVRADLTYQQGMRKLWSRKTRYDFYWPVFAMLGEQAVLNKEIYLDGSANDDLVFGYQERWAEYRYHPAMVTGYFRSTTPSTIDAWHYAQKFTALPTLNSTFIQESPPFSRVMAVGAAANGQQFLFDCFMSITKARPMPLYSVPGLIDHF